MSTKEKNLKMINEITVELSFVLFLASCDKKSRFQIYEQSLPLTAPVQVVRCHIFISSFFINEVR